MRILTLTLDMPLHPGDIAGFRAAISELVGSEADLFHQHVPQAEEAGGLRWEYPLIQYAVCRGRAMITGMEAGADALRQRLLPVLGDTLTFAGQPHHISGFSVQERQEALQVREEMQPFTLQGWLALNDTNYALWKSVEEPALRMGVLSSALTGHLRAFAQRVGFSEYKEIEARIEAVDNQKKVRWHGVDLLRFDVQAVSNLLPPEGIGIGRAAAFGFGQVQSPTQYLRWRGAGNRNISYQRR